MRIAQITDCHVTAEGTLWKGRVDMGARLDAAVARLNEIGPDLVVITGDLSDDSRPGEYQRAAAALAALRPPLHVLPGNHDDRAKLRAALPALDWGEGDFLQFAFDADGLRVIGLDTLAPGRVGGELCPARLDWLGRALGDGAGPALVFQHHPPCPLGLPFMDGWGFEGGDRQARIMAGRGVLRVACGHVHAGADAHWAGLTVSACPATGVQLPVDAPAEGPLTYTLEPPCIRLHDWRDGALTVKTVYVDAFPGPFPFPFD